ncbi:MAG: hypothetical protein F6J93_34310 [Oscillatoria sp. SIO1A7]|nr:hypothetical protein [Oscillatoria sp. SIO1A7]
MNIKHLIQDSFNLSQGYLQTSAIAGQSVKVRLQNGSTIAGVAGTNLPPGAVLACKAENKWIVVSGSLPKITFSERTVETARGSSIRVPKKATTKLKGIVVYSKISEKDVEVPINSDVSSYTLIETESNKFCYQLPHEAGEYATLEDCLANKIKDDFKDPNRPPPPAGSAYAVTLYYLASAPGFSPEIIWPDENCFYGPWIKEGGFYLGLGQTLAAKTATAAKNANPSNLKIAGMGAIAWRGLHEDRAPGAIERTWFVEWAGGRLQFNGGHWTSSKTLENGSAISFMGPAWDRNGVPTPRVSGVQYVPAVYVVNFLSGSDGNYSYKLTAIADGSSPQITPGFTLEFKSNSILTAERKGLFLGQVYVTTASFIEAGKNPLIEGSINQDWFYSRENYHASAQTIGAGGFNYRFYLMKIQGDSRYFSEIQEFVSKFSELFLQDGWTTLSFVGGSNINGCIFDESGISGIDDPNDRNNRQKPRSELKFKGRYESIFVRDASGDRELELPIKFRAFDNSLSYDEVINGSFYGTHVFINKKPGAYSPLLKVIQKGLQKRYDVNVFNDYNLFRNKSEEYNLQESYFCYSCTDEKYLYVDICFGIDFQLAAILDGNFLDKADSNWVLTSNGFFKYETGEQYAIVYRKIAAFKIDLSSFRLVETIIKSRSKANQLPSNLWMRSASTLCLYAPYPTYLSGKAFHSFYDFGADIDFDPNLSRSNYFNYTYSKSQIENLNYIAAWECGIPILLKWAAFYGNYFQKDHILPTSDWTEIEQLIYGAIFKLLETKAQALPPTWSGATQYNFIVPNKTFRYGSVAKIKNQWSTSIDLIYVEMPHKNFSVVHPSTGYSGEVVRPSQNLINNSPWAIKEHDESISIRSVIPSWYSPTYNILDVVSWVYRVGSFKSNVMAFLDTTIKKTPQEIIPEGLTEADRILFKFSPFNRSNWWSATNLYDYTLLDAYRTFYTFFFEDSGTLNFLLSDKTCFALVNLWKLENENVIQKEPIVVTFKGLNLKKFEDLDFWDNISAEAFSGDRLRVPSSINPKSAVGKIWNLVWIIS